MMEERQTVLRGELAHTRHYTRAAEHLFITQPRE